MALDRRGFLKFVAGGAVGTALTPLPWKMIDDISIWTQNWPWIPEIPDGELGSAPSLLKLGQPEYGIRVTTTSGNPVTAQGNPDHPLSMGGIDPLGASSVQLLYSPARVKTPLKKQNGGHVPISWEQALRELTQQLQEAGTRKNSLACISGDETSTANEVLAALLQGMDSDMYFFHTGDGPVYHQVWQQLMEGPGQVGFDMARADLVLSLGPDILESWGNAVRTQRLFGEDRFQLYYAGPVQNSTAAVADRWIPVPPESRGELALALAYHILQARSSPEIAITGYRDFRDFVLQNFQPQKAQKMTGLPESTIRELAQKLLQAKRPLVVPGSLSGACELTGFDLFAGLSLNALLGRINTAGGMQCIPDPPKTTSAAPSWTKMRSRDLFSALKGIEGENTPTPGIMFFYETNPVYSLPEKELARKALDRIPYKVSFSQFMDETAASCDLVLPNHYFLERLDDAFTPFPSSRPNYSLAEPVMEPVHDTRSTPDLILELCRKMGIGPQEESYEALLKKKAQILGADWEELANGSMWQGDTLVTQPEIRLWGSRISEMLHRSRQKASHEYPVRLALQSDRKTGTPQTSIPPFGLKTLREDELGEDAFYVRCNSRTARQHGFRDGSLVEIVSEQGSCRARITLDEGVMTNVLAVPLGFGHTEWDQFSRGKGDNATLLLGVRTEPGSGISHCASTRVQINKI